MDDPPPPKEVKTRRHGTEYTRLVPARRVTWRCEWCGEEYTEWRYPGPQPRYCETNRQVDRHGAPRRCRLEAESALAGARQQRKRDADTRPRRPVGRPAKASSTANIKN